MTSIIRFDTIQNTIGTTVATINQAGSISIPGTVVQMVDYKYPSLNDNYTLIADATEYLTPITITITPKFANSKLVIHAEGQCRYVNAIGVTAGLKRDGNVINGSINFGSLNFSYKGDTVNHHTQMVVNTSVIAGSTSPTTFTYWLKPYSGTAEWNQGWGNNYIQVWEIAQ